MRFLFFWVFVFYGYWDGNGSAIRWLSAAYAEATPIDPFEKQIRDNLKVEKFQLKNGLTVLLHVDHAIPMVAYHQWYRVGSARERPGRTGIAHFFEHLMFKGTKKYPGSVYESVIQGNGGSNNAFTTRDYTGYYTYLPSDKLELVIDIESDRMRNLLFQEGEINSEREVVKEERRMRFENDIYGALNELLYSTVFKTSSYRWPIIGYMADLNATTMDELKSFYQKYYAPNNSVIVIAGSFEPAKAKALIEKYYGQMEPQDIPQFKFTPEAVQRASRRARIEKDVQSTTAAFVYPTREAGHVDNYALDLAANILGEGTSSRLYKSLVYQKQIATSVSAYHANGKYAGTFHLTLGLKPGVSVARVKPLIENELAALQKRPVTAEELQKSKNQVMMSYIGSLKTIGGKARVLALNEVYFGDYTVMFQDLGRYNAVTAEDIRRVSQTYFRPDKLSFVSVEPKAKAASTMKK